MFELVDNIPQSPVIKVIGVGGGGGNAVNHMVKSNIEGVEFICANTDAQALKSIGARTILQLGTGVTKGLGAGANPEVGRQAALEDRERIAEVLQGTNSAERQVAVRTVMQHLLHCEAIGVVTTHDLELASEVLAGEFRVLADVAADHLADLPRLEQQPEAGIVDAGIV